MYWKDPIEEFKDWSGHGVPSDLSAFESAQRALLLKPTNHCVHDGSSKDMIETRLRQIDNWTITSGTFRPLGRQGASNRLD